MQYKKENSAPPDLRDRAEEIIRRQQSAPKNSSPAELQKLIEELQVHQIELELQNEELRRTQLELEEAKDKYFDLYNFAPAGYLTMDKNNIIREVNLVGADMLSQPRSTLIGKPLSTFIEKNSQDLFYLHRRSLIETRQKQTCELLLLRKSKPEFPARLECRPSFDEKGNLKQILAVLIDISVQKQAEKQIQENLREKEVLLQELNHRTKNNMQIILSMIHIKVQLAVDETQRAPLRELENKIYAMELVHEKVYQAKNLLSINLKTYCTELVSLVYESFFAGDKRVRILSDFHEIDVPIDTATTLGLILNELLTNALKYAFPGGRKGEIRILLTVDDAQNISLEVADNGAGVSPDFSMEKDANIGLSLVHRLVINKLAGSMEIENKDGFQCRIRIEKMLHKPPVDGRPL
jgi:two-component system, sensor histidine kinase PdtaS